jgi:dolichol kinase
MIQAVITAFLCGLAAYLAFIGRPELAVAVITGMFALLQAPTRKDGQ